MTTLLPYLIITLIALSLGGPIYRALAERDVRRRRKQLGRQRHGYAQEDLEY